MTQFKRVITRLGEHSAFVRREDVSIVIIDQRTEARTCRTAQVDVTNGSIRQHTREDQRRIKLPKWPALPIDLQNPPQSSLVESQPLLGIVLLVLLRLDRYTR